jgi:hypothetical protein
MTGRSRMRPIREFGLSDLRIGHFQHDPFTGPCLVAPLSHHPDDMFVTTTRGDPAIVEGGNTLASPTSFTRFITKSLSPTALPSAP